MHRSRSRRTRTAAPLVVLALTATTAPIPAARADAYDVLVQQFLEETAQYRSDGQLVRPRLPDRLPAHDRFVSVAQEIDGAEEALPFLGWLLQNSPRNPDAHGYAVGRLDAIASERAAELATSNPDWDALAEASRKSVYHLKYNTVDDRTFATTLLDLKVLARAADDDAVRAAAQRSVFKLERLQEGMVAPDIAGEDFDGVAFKLSDYRGKVVVVDFWGDW